MVKLNPAAAERAEKAGAKNTASAVSDVVGAVVRGLTAIAKAKDGDLASALNKAGVQVSRATETAWGPRDSCQMVKGYCYTFATVDGVADLRSTDQDKLLPRLNREIAELTEGFGTIEARFNETGGIDVFLGREALHPGHALERPRGRGNRVLTPELAERCILAMRQHVVAGASIPTERALRWERAQRPRQHADDPAPDDDTPKVAAGPLARFKLDKPRS